MPPAASVSTTSMTSSSTLPSSASLPTGSSTSPSRHANPLLSSSVPHAEEPSPTDLLLATPPAVLKFLTLAAPVIHFLTYVSQLINWQGHFFASLLLLLAWWSVCLFGYYIFKFGAPAVVLAYILFTYLASFSSRQGPNTGNTLSKSTPALARHRHRPTPLTPANFHSLLHSSQILANDVQSLRADILHPISVKLSFIPTHPGRAAPAYHTAWIVLTSYPFYLALTYFVPLRLIFLTIGSIGLLWNAPFFKTLRKTLWKSAFVRWIVRISIALVSGGRGLGKELKRTQSGVGVAGLLGKKKQVGGEKTVVIKEATVKVGTTSSQGSKIGDSKIDKEADEGEDVQVQFTVFENQRWWVGLDWTHALLPGERASWTDPALNPANPPSSFLLPPPSITYTASPTRSDPNSRLKRTTEWKWLDTEWRVMRSSPSSNTGATSTSNLVTTNADGSIITNTINKSPSLSAALQSYISSNPNPTLNSNSNSSANTSSDEIVFPPSLIDSQFFEQDYKVDTQGWSFSDNQWENQSPKGGLGKYTRRRAWVRRAHLVERVERVSGPTTNGTGVGTGASGGTSSGSNGGLGTSGVGLKSAGLSGTSTTKERRKSEIEGSLRRRKSSKSSSSGNTAGVEKEKENKVG